MSLIGVVKDADYRGSRSTIDILKAKINTYTDLFADPQVQAVDALHWVENDTLGRVSAIVDHSGYP